jgi:DNA-binding CsgD family transcriptional regulator
MPRLTEQGRRALEQVRLIAADASDAGLLARRALDAIDSAVPFDDGAIFGIDHGSRVFNRLLAYRGAEPGALRDWIRDASALTGAQWAVAEAVGRGLSDREIADALQISPATVHGHVAALHELLGMNTRPRLVAELAGALPPRDR